MSDIQYFIGVEKGMTVTYRPGLSGVEEFGDWVLVDRGLSNVPCRPGVYLIIHDDTIVYVGSAQRLVLRIYKHEKYQKSKAHNIYFIEHRKYKHLENVIISKIQPIWNKIGVGKNIFIYKSKGYKIQNDRGHIHIIVSEKGKRKKISLNKLDKINGNKRVVADLS